MPKPTTTLERDADDRVEIDYDRFASYEDGDGIVICDRKDPKAWIRSDVTTALER